LRGKEGAIKCERDQKKTIGNQLGEPWGTRETNGTAAGVEVRESEGDKRFCSEENSPPKKRNLKTEVVKVQQQKGPE